MDTVAESQSVRRKSGVLGLRRQTYYARKRGHRSEQEDKRIAELLHQVTKQFVAWGFWLVFYYLRNQGFSWNHKRVYRVWKQQELHLRRLPKRAKLKRVYQDLLAPEQVNEGWAMDFLSEWIVGMSYYFLFSYRDVRKDLTLHSLDIFRHPRNFGYKV